MHDRIQQRANYVVPLVENILHGKLVLERMAQDANKDESSVPNKLSPVPN